MASRHEVEVALAVQAEGRGDALAATVRWCLAAEAARGDTERLRALGAARRSVELAMHQAVYDARNREHGRRPGWRALASAAGVPLQTFHHRYRAAPSRSAPARVEVSTSDVAGLLD